MSVAEGIISAPLAGSELGGTGIGDFPMRNWIIGNAALAALMLAACGQGGGGTGDVHADAAVVEPSAEQRAEAEAAETYFDPALTRPRCPARVDTAQYPGPELLGLRLGMTRAEAIAIAYCERRDFHVDTNNRFFSIDTRGERLGPQTITLRDGNRHQCTVEEVMGGLGVERTRGCGREVGAWVYKDTKQIIHIVTPGRPGQERVMGIWRTEEFGDNAPTTDATQASLIQRFGEPSLRSEQTYSRQVFLYWVYDTAGALMTSTNPQTRECAQNIAPGYRAEQRWSSNCGLTIVGVVRGAESNPAVASSYHIAIMNQQVMHQLGAAMEQHYAQAELAAREAEVERAKGAAAPEL
jgi:hypothetical protein